PDLRGCALYVYDTQTRITKKVPSVDRRPQYGGAVDETNGVMFFARAGHACGRGVTFYQLPVSALGSTPVKVSSLPRGFDLDFTASLALNPTTNAFDYFFSRFRCGVHFTGEIYALRGVSPGA